MKKPAIKRLSAAALALLMLSAPLSACTRSGPAPEDDPDLCIGVNKNDLWGAELFSGSSLVYDNDLALFCARLAQDSTRLDDLTARFEECGFNGYEHFNYLDDKSDTVDGRFTGADCFAVGHDVLLINGKVTAILVVVARGSLTINEFITDFTKRFTEPVAHSEPKYGAESMICDNVYYFCEQIAAGVDRYVAAHAAELDKPRLKLLVCGHSLGGAAADLTACDFNNGVRFDGTPKEDIYAYTFGAIQTLSGSVPNVSEGYENIHNVFNYYDSFAENGSKSILGASSYYSKFGHTEFFRSERFHPAESLLLDAVSVFADNDACPNHVIKLYIAALEYEKEHPGMLELSCDPSATVWLPESGAPAPESDETP